MADTYTETLDKRQMSLLRLAEDMIRSIANPALEAAYNAARLAIMEKDAPNTQIQMSKLKEAAGKAYQEALTDALEPLNEQLDELAILEAGFTAKAITDFTDLAVSIPADKKLKKYVDNSVIMFHGKNEQAFTFDEYLKDFYESEARNVRNAIAAEWAAQVNTDSLPSLDDYAKRVQVVSDGLNKQSAKTLVRTGVNHFSTSARMAFYKDNDDVIERMFISVTFDNRISKICVSIGDKYGPGSKGFTMDKPPKEGLPAYHPNCRSAVIAVPVGMDIEGDKAAIAAREGGEDAFKAREDRLRTKSKVTYKGRKDDVLYAKEISAATPIAKFLRSQPDYYQDDVLGKTLGKAFREGKVDLSQITTDSLEPKTIKELGLN